MKIIKAYKNGFKVTISNLRLITVGYLFLLIPGLLIALAYWSSFKSAIGNFIAPGNLLNGFDYTTYTELMRFEGEKISAATTQAILLVVFYVFVSLFISGGIVYSLNNKSSKGNFLSMLTGGSRFFWRFLKLNLYTFIIHLIIAAIIYIPFAILVKGSLEHAETEKYIFFLFLPFGIIHLILMIYLFTINNYAKFALVHNNSRKVIRLLWAAIKFVTVKICSTYTLTLLLLVVPLLFLFGYMKFSGSFGISSAITIIIVFIVQQVSVWLRMANKIWFLSGQFEYYLINNRED